MSNSVRSGEPDRLVDFAGLGGDVIAEFFQHVGDHHADHRLVFDQEHGAGRHRRHAGVLTRIPGNVPGDRRRQRSIIPEYTKVANNPVRRNVNLVPVFDHELRGSGSKAGTDVLSLLGVSRTAMPLAAPPPEKMMFQLSLRRRGISDQAVLRAMDAVPRDRFVMPELRDEAWRDTALPIACGQTISQPFVVAYMTEQLQLKPEHRVLEIGTGSGYQAAVLARLCRQVLTLERFKTLADRARARLESLDCHNVEVQLGDGFDVPAKAGTVRPHPGHRGDGRGAARR